MLLQASLCCGEVVLSHAQQTEVANSHALAAEALHPNGDSQGVLVKLGRSHKVIQE